MACRGNGSACWVGPVRHAGFSPFTAGTGYAATNDDSLEGKRESPTTATPGFVYSGSFSADPMWSINSPL